jgi:hypothetical protein
MKVHYKALMTAASVLQLEANITRNERRSGMLDEVASALLTVANGAGVIEFDNEHEYKDDE